MLKSRTQKILNLVDQLDQSFDQRFQILARDPKILAFVAATANSTAFVKLELRKFEAEALSLKTRLQSQVQSDTRETVIKIFEFVTIRAKK